MTINSKMFQTIIQQLQNLIHISLKHNDKRPQYAWKHIQESKVINLDHDNLGVLTGYRNSITVIDLDFPRYEMHSDFVEEFGKDYMKTFDTFAVRSTRGGYHLYFEYEPNVVTCVCEKHQIDVRNDGAYIVAPPSTINGQAYTVHHDSSIKKMPDKLKQWIIHNVIPNKKNNPVAVKRGVKRVCGVGKNTYQCTMKADELKTILTLLPTNVAKNEDYRGSYQLWYRVGLACAFTGHFEIFDEWSQATKHGNYDDNQCRTHWNNWSNSCQVFHLQWLLHITGTQNFYTFKQVHSKLENFITINKEKLDGLKDKRFFKNNKNYMIKSDTGTGKTTAFLKYIEQQKNPFISIVSRVVLGLEQADNMRSNGIDVQIYQDKKFQYGDNIIITPESCSIIMSYDFSNYIIFLDEFDSIVRHITTSTTLNRNRVKVFGALIKMITTCKQFIAVDADISVVSQHLLQQIGRPYCFKVNEFKNYANVKVNIINNEEEFFNMVKKEKKYLLATDSKTTAEIGQIKADAEDGTPIKIITSDTDEKERIKLDDHNKAIYSPKLLYGLDSTMRRKVFAHYKGHTISPTAMVQQITRCRDIKCVNIFFKQQSTMPCMYDTMKEMSQAYRTSLNHFNKEIDELYDDEDESENKKFMEEADKLYSHLFYMVNYIEDCYQTNKFLHLINIMKARGFEVKQEKRTLVQSMKTSEIKKQINEFKSENFDVENPIVKRVNEMLKVKPCDIDDYKEFFIDSNKLSKHFTYSAYFRKDMKENLQNLECRGDFDLNKAGDRIMKFKLLDDMQSVIGCTKETILDYIPNHDKIESSIAEGLLKRYIQLFKITSKNLKFEDQKDVYETTKKIYRSMFDFVGVKRKSHNGDRTYMIAFDEEIIKQHDDLIKYRTKK